MSASGVLAHTKRVCSLYKRSLRNLESLYDRRNVLRYQAILLRDRFERNRCEIDLIKAQELVMKGEKELFEKQHYQPKKFPNSPGGTSYEREVIPPDWVLDYWNPLEKAQYPEYFKKRELRKKEYIERWEKEYGKPVHDGTHH